MHLKTWELLCAFGFSRGFAVTCCCLSGYEIQKKAPLEIRFLSPPFSGRNGWGLVIQMGNGQPQAQQLFSFKTISASPVQRSCVWELSISSPLTKDQELGLGSFPVLSARCDGVDDRRASRTAATADPSL